jgi:hypothetical protein
VTPTDPTGTQGIDAGRSQVVDAGPPREMDAGLDAWRLDAAPEPRIDGGPVPWFDAGPDPGVYILSRSGCVPFEQGRYEPFELAQAPADRSVSEEIARASSLLQGTWYGTAVSPWMPPTWYVTVSFSQEGAYFGRYDAHSQAGAPVPAFYFGSDLPCDLKQWRLLSADRDAGVSGEIDIPFQTDACQLPSWQGELIGITFDATGNQVDFEFKTSDGYGPVIYGLWRTCAPAAYDAGSPPFESCAVPSDGCDY